MMMMKILNILMTMVFLFSVIVQYNDPDPLVWMAIYGIAGAACVLEILKRGKWIFPAAICLVSLVWAISLAWTGWDHVSFGELVSGPYRMKDERIEIAREVVGLLIVALWMAILS